MSNSRVSTIILLRGKFETCSGEVFSFELLCLVASCGIQDFERFRLQPMNRSPYTDLSKVPVALSVSIPKMK